MQTVTVVDFYKAAQAVKINFFILHLSETPARNN